MAIRVGIACGGGRTPADGPVLLQTLGVPSALREERVVAAVLINAGALVWDDELMSHREGRKIARLQQFAWRRKILRCDHTLRPMQAQRAVRRDDHLARVRAQHAPQIQSGP